MKWWKATSQNVAKISFLSSEVVKKRTFHDLMSTGATGYIIYIHDKFVDMSISCDDVTAKVLHNAKPQIDFSDITAIDLKK